MKRIGILALQGDFHAHELALLRAGADPIEVRSASQLTGCDAIVMPGGESTAMIRLLHASNLWNPLAEFLQHRPAFATCAGAILLASDVRNPAQDSFAAVDMTIERNAYGRQVDSRIAHLQPEPAAPLPDQIEAVFIRAPIIRGVGPSGQTLLKYNDDPVLVDFGRHLVATFHPELTTDPWIHKLFLARL
jgi:5'-phosphate synthase pdxT subunit